MADYLCDTHTVTQFDSSPSPHHLQPTKYRRVNTWEPPLSLIGISSGSTLDRSLLILKDLSTTAFTMFSLWALMLLQTTAKASELTKTVAVVEEVATQYRPACIFLLYSRFRDLHQNTVVHDTGRALRKHGFLVDELDVDSLWQIPLQCRLGLPPLCVLMQGDEPSRVALQRVLSRGDGCDPTWLVIFSRESDDWEHFFSDLSISYNCRLLALHTQLSEVYRVAPGFPLRNYTCRTVVDCNPLHINERRGNLEGLVMRGVTVHEPPVSVIKKYLNNTIKVTGFFGDVWEALEDMMNFTTKFRLMQTYGRLKNGNWSGMVGALQRKEADVAVAEFTMTPSRLNDVDYPLPILYTRYQVYVRPLNNDDPSWSDFLIPFTSSLWFTVVGTLFLFSIFLTMMHAIGCRHGNEEAYGPPFYGLYDSVLYVYGIFCQQGQDFNPRSISCRLVYLSACVMAVVLLGAYSAALISSLTRPYINLPFHDLRGLVQTGTYVLGTLNESAELDIFKDSDDSILQQIYRRMDVVGSTEEGLDKACAGKYAFLTTVFMLQAVAAQKPLCGLVPVPDAYFPSSLTIALAKNSPFKALIDHNLHVMRDRGTLKALRARWWSRKLPAVRNLWTEVELRNISPILVVLVCGLIIACVLMFIECRWRRHESFFRRLMSPPPTLPLKRAMPRLQLCNSGYYKRYNGVVFHR